MNKIYGWSLITLCVLFFIIFGIMVYTLSTRFNTDVELTANNIFAIIVSIIFFIALLVLGVLKGIKLIKKNEPNEIIEFVGTLAIKYNGKIKFEDYRNLIFELTYKKPRFYFIFGAMAIFFVVFLTSDNLYDGNNIIFFLIFPGFLIGSPLLTYFQIKNMYKANKMLVGYFDYEITNDSIQVSGETANSTQKWANFIMIKETKKFFLLYQSTAIATLIEKGKMNENEVVSFRQFVQSLDVKKEGLKLK
ncbi:MAG: YcxB family protein [Bacteroidia bacterium]